MTLFDLMLISGCGMLACAKWGWEVGLLVVGVLFFLCPRLGK